MPNPQHTTIGSLHALPTSRLDAGESGGDVFMLLHGELHVMDADQETFLFKIPEGTVFGEGTVLRRLEVRHRTGLAAAAVAAGHPS